MKKALVEFKKQHKAKQREADKAKKKERQLKAKVQSDETVQTNNITSPVNKLPWILLALSWLGFIAFAVITNT